MPTFAIARRAGALPDFVLEAGWTPREWMRWVSDTLIRDLFPAR